MALTTHLPLFPPTLVSMPESLSLSMDLTTDDLVAPSISATAVMEREPSSASSLSTSLSRESSSISDGMNDIDTVTRSGSSSSVNLGSGSPRSLQ